MIMRKPSGKVARPERRPKIEAINKEKERALIKFLYELHPNASAEQIHYLKDTKIQFSGNSIDLAIKSLREDVERRKKQFST